MPDLEIWRFGESEVLCQNNNWLIKEISVRVSSSSDDQSNLHAGPEKLQLFPFLPCCMVNKWQLLCITRAILLSNLCSEGTCSSPALVSVMVTLVAITGTCLGHVCSAGWQKTPKM